MKKISRISCRQVKTASYDELRNQYLPAMEEMFNTSYDALVNRVRELGGKYEKDMSPEELNEIKALKNKIRKIYFAMKDALPQQSPEVPT